MFDNGEIKFYSVSNSALAGQKPKKTYTQVHYANYDERTVGLNRYAVARQNDTQIDIMVRLPRTYELNTKNVAVLQPYSHIDNSVYRIYQIQQADNENGLPITDISLERLEGLNANEVINISDGISNPQ